MIETIYKDYCPDCEAVNYLNMGDMSDLTAYEPDGIECHKCGHQWLFDEDNPLKDYGEPDFEIGQKTC